MLNSLTRVFVGIYAFLYRQSGGKFGGKMQGLKVLLLTTTGRKSGKKRITPLGYFEQDGGYVIVGSNNGRDTNPAWFYNLRSNPRATIEIGDKKSTVNADIALSDKRNQLWARLIEIAPYYANYVKMTSREIPMVTLRPAKS